MVVSLMRIKKAWLQVTEQTVIYGYQSGFLILNVFLETVDMPNGKE